MSQPRPRQDLASQQVCLQPPRKEQEFARGYADKLQDPLLAVSLNQNPAKHGQSSSRRILHAMIRNCGIVYIPAARRWLTPREMMYAQAFPRGKTVFDFAGQAKRSHSTMCSQMGNSMNVACCGAMWCSGKTVIDGAV